MPGVGVCHSGGFWGDNNLSDSGDLEKLPRSALLASAPEWGVSFSVPDSGRGLWTLVLEEALSAAVGIQEIAQYITDWDWNEFVGKELPLRIVDFFPPWNATLTFDPTYWEPVYYSTADFTMSFPY